MIPSITRDDISEISVHTVRTVVPTLIRDGPPANGQSNLMKSFPVILVDLGSSVQVGFQRKVLQYEYQHRIFFCRYKWK